MSFFKRILKEPEPPAKPAPAVERRTLPRYPINPEFPLKAVLSFIGRDESGAPMSNTRHGWNWKGRLIDCSEEGARIQMGPAVKLQDGEPCDLKLSVQDHEIIVPCHVTNLGETPEGIVLGLKHAIDDAATGEGYRQLVDVVALGSTLKLESAAKKPDASGYLVEIYASNRPSRLTVWRHPADESVMAFEFVLQDNMVRAAAGQRVEFLSDLDGTGSRPANTEKCLEIGRLFQWVVPNLPADMPEEVRGFLKHYAG
jgi:hypothetical protein